VHVVLDNLSAHSTPEIAKWLAHKDRRRWHFHYTPTSSSWLNLIERWFKELTDKRLRRGTFTSIADLTEAITTWAALALYAGPLPDADTLALPTTQTFADGTTEAWTEQATGGEKPKFPVPTATIAKPASSVLPIVAWSALGLSVVALALAVFGIDRVSRRSGGADAPDAEPLSPSPASA
jgi:hypothetical protein